jgi:hypothetical protein
MIDGMILYILMSSTCNVLKEELYVGLSVHGRFTCQ